MDLKIFDGQLTLRTFARADRSHGVAAVLPVSLSVQCHVVSLNQPVLGEEGREAQVRPDDGCGSHCDEKGEEKHHVVYLALNKT